MTKQSSLLPTLNLHLIKIKGQEIANIVCKQNISIEISSDIMLSSEIWDLIEEKSKIRISTKIFESNPLQALRNFRVNVAHQASHLYLSEIQKWKRWYKQHSLRFFIAKLIEDKRCNNFLVNRYPGLKRDFVSYLAYQFLHQMNVQDISESVRFLLALFQIVTFGRIKGNITLFNKFQIEKMNNIKNILERIKWSYLFEEELLPSAEKIFNLISNECLQKDDFDYSQTEILLSDFISKKNRLEESDNKNYELYEQKIYDEFSKEFAVKMEPSEIEKKLLKDLFGIDIDFENEDLKLIRDKKIKQYFSKNPLEILIPKEDWSFFSEIKLQVLSQIRKISSDFLFIKQAQDWEENYRTGPCLANDFVQRLLNKDDHIFKRYIEKEFDTKWLILTDVSSSVNAPEVTQFTILLSEVARVALKDYNFCICAFCNNFYVVKDFNEGYDRLVKGRIGGMYSGGTTNMCDSIDFCINRLDKFPSETKVLIVITDGEPNTCKNENPEEHTKINVKKSFTHDIFTIGIGTKSNINIHKYFPIHFTVTSLNDFPKLFQRIYSMVLFESEKPIQSI